ncbi:hypothetical protein B0H34DRAFT_713765 [Crassisporium funariophilum]|nr:hypothetical protein B0H34DRAFT_713765 [Crassisporium funariophilum]
MLLDARSHMPSPSPKLQDRYSFASSDTSDSSLGSHDADPASLSTSSLPTPSLLVTNLPTLLFSQAQDLHPLFFPFGHIEKLEIVQVSPLGTMSVVVQYATANVAQEAKDTLGGQLYGSYQIEARFVKAATSCLVDPLYVSSTGLNCFDKASYGACPTMNKPPVQSRVTSGHAGPCCDPDGGDNDTRVLRSDRFGHTNNTFSRYNSLDSKPRQSPLSATPAAFSDVFRDSDNSRSSSTVSRSIPFFELVDHAHQRLSSSRWNLDQNYGLPSRRQFAPPNHMHYNTVYHCQSSNAA